MKLKEKLKEIKNILISNKKQNLNLPIPNNKEEINTNITILENNGLVKVEISDYIDISNYMKKMKLIDTLNIDNKLSTNIMWNSSKQCINKGIYYVFCHNERLYNILIDKNIIKIDERINIEKETQEKIFEIDLKNLNYHYFSYVHDQYGSTYQTRYYSKNKPILINLALSNNEFINDLNSILSNLEIFKYIDSILDINNIKYHILNDNIGKQMKLIK